jgi:hypothetical protein
VSTKPRSIYSLAVSLRRSPWARQAQPWFAPTSCPRYSALRRGLNFIASQSYLSVYATETGMSVSLQRNRVLLNDSEPVSPVFSPATVSTMEVLIEELIYLHASSPTFRLVFQSQQTNFREAHSLWRWEMLSLPLKSLLFVFVALADLECRPPF